MTINQRGPTGRAGADGATGAVGAAGADGAVGATGPAGDPLLYYRVSKLEQIVDVMSQGVATMAAEFRGLKLAFLFTLGIIQPVGIGVAIYFITH